VCYTCPTGRRGWPVRSKKMDLDVLDMELARERAEQARLEGDYGTYRLAVAEISRCEQSISRRLERLAGDA